MGLIFRVHVREKDMTRVTGTLSSFAEVGAFKTTGGRGALFEYKKNSTIENLQFGFQLLCILYKVGDSLTPRPPSE
jgi:hypothetical protein